MLSGRGLSMSETPFSWGDLNAKAMRANGELNSGSEMQLRAEAIYPNRFA